jgi:hypothetical protein
VTGGLFFVPTATFLDDVADTPATDGAAVALTPTSPKANTPAAGGSLADAAGSSTASAGSLKIGSLKGQPNE